MVNIEENPLYYAAIAGLIIGIATSLNYAFRKSVTGMSGMLYSTVTLDKSTFSFNHRRNAKKYRYYWRHDANRRHLLWCFWVRNIQQIHTFRPRILNHHLYIPVGLCSGRDLSWVRYKAFQWLHKRTWSLWNRQTQHQVLCGFHSILGIRLHHSHHHLSCWWTGTIHSAKILADNWLWSLHYSKYLHCFGNTVTTSWILFEGLHCQWNMKEFKPNFIKLWKRL